MPVVERVNPYSRYFYVPDPEGSGAPPPSTQDLRDIFGPEAEQVQEELGRLLREYRSTILYGQRHYAASPSWREENVLLPGKGAYVSSRFAIRVHLFEAASNVLEKSQLGIEHAGRYLGFVPLRPPGSEIVLAEQGTATKGFRYVVEAELVPPRQMLRPRYHVLTTTVGAARLGVLPFRSAVFMPSHAESASGSSCMNVAVSQALHLTTVRFGSRPVSQREFDALLWQEENRRTLQSIAAEGVNFQETLKVLTKCHAGGFIESFSLPLHDGDERTVRLDACRCLSDLLTNGLPVIVAVNHAKLLYPEIEVKDDIPMHGTLITGMHLLHTSGENDIDDASVRVDFAELPGRFIGHDSVRGPFVEWSVPHLFDAALAVPHGESADRRIEFLAIGPPGINMSLSSARLKAQLLANVWPQSDIEAYLDRFGGKLEPVRLEALRHGLPEERESWRYVVRLTDFDDLFGRYFKKQAAGGREEIAIQLAPEGLWPLWWCVEARVPELGGLDFPPVLVFFWAANDPEDFQARGTCVLNPDGTTRLVRHSPGGHG